LKQSLKQQLKVKMKVKMIIVVKMGGSILPKMAIFNSFSCSFFTSFLKNGRKMKTENEAKMVKKWLL